MHASLKAALYALFGALAAAAITTTSALAGSGVGATFNLGQLNSVNATSKLAGSAAPLLDVGNSATSGGATAVVGRMASSSAGSGSAGVKGVNPGTGFDRYGVFGTGGTGVVGKHTAGTGTGAGVEGDTSSISANAVGVLGQASSNDQIGVLGRNPHSSGIGVVGCAKYGTNFVANCLNQLSEPTGGVGGEFLAPAVAQSYGYGVIAKAFDAHSIGVQGVSPNVAVEGVSASGTALHALTSNGIGLNASTTDGVGVLATSTARAVIGTDGSACPGTYAVGGCADGGYGVYGKSNSNDAVHGESTNLSGVAGSSVNGDGIYGESTFGYAGYFVGDVHVQGTLTASSKSFQIDDPLDPQHKYLQHTSVESPDMKDVYDGNVTTDAKGFATIRLPSYFQALNRSFRYQLTVIDRAHWTARAAVWSKIARNRFTIRTDQPHVQISWQVTGIRHDAWANANRTPVIVPKTAAG